jgi:hypothetical protein
MQQEKVEEFSSSFVLQSAWIGLDFRLPLADSIIPATTCFHNAVPWTRDDGFGGITGVRYFPELHTGGLGLQTINSAPDR